jgi:hypothetical protein
MATEKRLIDRNEIFPNGTFFANAEDPLKSLDELIKRIWSIRTVDAVEVVHGHWEPRKDVPGFLRCSACHDCNIYDDWPDGKKWNYCPNCGAKMDGDGNG